MDGRPQRNVSVRSVRWGAVVDHQYAVDHVADAFVVQLTVKAASCQSWCSQVRTLRSAVGFEFGVAGADAAGLLTIAWNA